MGALIGAIVLVALLLWAAPWLIFSAGPYLLAAAVIVFALMVAASAKQDARKGEGDGSPDD